MWPSVGSSKNPGDYRFRVEHQVPANQSAAVGEAVGEHVGRGAQEKPGGTNAIARHHDHPGLLSLDRALGVVVDGPICQPVAADRDLPDAAVRSEPDAFSRRPWASM